MFVDTNVLIDLLRGKAIAKDFIEKYRGSIKISVIVKLELIDGLKSKSDIISINKLFIKALQIEEVQINDEISILAEKLFMQYRHSHGISINDAIIAATSLIFGEPLYTYNKKHFGFIPKLILI